MAWPKITGDGENGGVTVEFVAMRGNINRTGQAVEEITRPGVDGHAYRQVGKRAAPSDLICTTDCDTGADAKTTAASLQSLQGYMVEITDGHSQTYGRLMLLEVEVLGTDKVEGGSGGISTLKGAILTVRLRVQATDY